MSRQLNTHLADMDERVQAMFSRLVEYVAAQDGVTEELKAKDQMRWTGLMNNTRLVRGRSFMIPWSTFDGSPRLEAGEIKCYNRDMKGKGGERFV